MKHGLFVQVWFITDTMHTTYVSPKLDPNPTVDLYKNVKNMWVAF